MSTDSRVLTQEELWSEAKERFGQNTIDWAFRCPSCGDIATGMEFFKALAERRRKHREFDRSVYYSDILGQECIGRTLGKEAGRGCMYAAYGLIPGPWQVAIPHRTKPMYCFPLAPAPASEAGEG